MSAPCLITWPSGRGLLHYSWSATLVTFFLVIHSLHVPRVTAIDVPSLSGSHAVLLSERACPRLGTKVSDIHSITYLRKSVNGTGPKGTLVNISKQPISKKNLAFAAQSIAWFVIRTRSNLFRAELVRRAIQYYLYSKCVHQLSLCAVASGSIGGTLIYR